MAHRQLSDFVPDVLAKGPYTAPSNVAEDAVRRTAIDLCERAGVWQYEFNFCLQDGVPDYPIFVPDLTRLVCVGWVEINGRKYIPAPGSRSCQCGPYGVTIPDTKTVWIAPLPSTPAPVRMNIWLTPMQEACDLPEVLWQEYSDVIANGAASRLLQMPKQDYTNQGLAARLYTMYEGGVTRAKNKRVLERTTGPLLMRGAYF